MDRSDDVRWQTYRIKQPQREARLGQRGMAVWLTGLSGAGKSTLAEELENRLFAAGASAYVLDGDNVRHGLCGDLGFSQADRSENIRRVGEVAKLFVDAGLVVITALISPLAADRERARRIVGDGRFIEVYCQCDLDTCERRDVKGLYARARRGEIRDFTGVSAPYEAPARPEVTVDTQHAPVDQCVARIMAHLAAEGVLPGAPRR